MVFRYPAATTSPTDFGTRWCSKLYLRSACVSSANAAFRAASDASESAASLCSVAGAASLFAPWAGGAVEIGTGREDSVDCSQPASTKAMSNGATTREDMAELDLETRKTQAARLQAVERGRILERFRNAPDHLDRAVRASRCAAARGGIVSAKL